jgi:type IV secretory pathway TraG/TraD family ATPase VirD4
MSLRSQHDAVRVAAAVAVALFVVFSVAGAHYYSRAGARNEVEVSWRWRVLEARAWVAAGVPGAPLFGDPGLRAGEVLARAGRSAMDATDRMIHVAPLLGGTLTLAVGAVVLFLRAGAAVTSGDKHRRGARLVSTQRLRARLAMERARDRLLRRRVPQLPITIGGLALPAAAETTHQLVTGATGSGKTQLIRAEIETIRARGERAIVADVGGDLMACYARKGDAILNPLDRRSVIWSPFAEMEGDWDADRLAASIIPAAEGESGQWNGYAQSIVSAVLRRLYQREQATNERLVYLLTAAPQQELAALVAGLPAARLFEPAAERMLSNVLGIVGAHMGAYSYLSPGATANDYSIRRWVSNEDDKSWLWLPYRDDQVDTLRPLLAAWVGIAASAAMSLRPSRTRRLWLVADEVASLGRVGSLIDVLTKGRKYGLCALLGLQSISQLRDAYGREGAQTLLSCLSTVCVLRTPDPETSDYLSQFLGEEETTRAETTRGEKGESVSERRSINRLVLASEIQKLPEREGFLSLAGDYPVARVKIPIVHAPERVKAFVPRAAS